MFTELTAGSRLCRWFGRSTSPLRNNSAVLAADLNRAINLHEQRFFLLTPDFCSP
jgi:hypothetical protein